MPLRLYAKKETDRFCGAFVRENAQVVGTPEPGSLLREPMTQSVSDRQNGHDNSTEHDDQTERAATDSGHPDYITEVSGFGDADDFVRCDRCGATGGTVNEFDHHTDCPTATTDGGVIDTTGGTDETDARERHADAGGWYSCRSKSASWPSRCSGRFNSRTNTHSKDHTVIREQRRMLSSFRHSYFCLRRYPEVSQMFISRASKRNSNPMRGS